MGDVLRLELGKYNLKIDSEKEPPSDEDNIVETNNDNKNIVSESNTNSKEKTTKKIETTEENNLNSELTQNSKLKIYSQDLITYDGKEFKKFPKLNAYNQKRKIKKIVYKLQYWRKDEKLRIETNQKPFCEATIEYIEKGQKVKSGYFFKKYHSL